MDSYLSWSLSLSDSHSDDFILLKSAIHNTSVCVCVCFVQLCATLGSTGVCSFDRLDELGPVCKCVSGLHE